MAFRNFTEAISRLSISSVVLVCSTACMRRSGTAVIRPKAVQFIATEMLADSRFAFCAGSMVATAAKALDETHDGAQEPEESREVGKGRDVECVRFSRRGTTSIMLSSIAFSISSRRRADWTRATP